MQNQLLRSFVRCLVGISLLTSVSGQADFSQKQSLFLDVEKSLKQGEIDLYLTHRSEFNNYPLAGYLDYLNLINQFDEIGQSDINQFENRYPDLPQSSQLKFQWISWLAKQKRWDEYLQAYEYMDIRGGRYQCLKGIALLSLNQEAKAWREAQALWLIGKSQHKACNPLFAQWREAGMLTQSLSFQRFWMAVSAGNTSLARYIDRHISQPGYKEATSLFWRIHKKPRLLTSTLLLDGSIKHHRIILLHGIKRLLSSDRDKAVDIWLRLRERYPFEEKQISRINQRLAMKFAKNFADNASEQIALIDPDYQFPDITKWRIRLALARESWEETLQLIQKLPAELRKGSRWKYWQSVAQLKTNSSPGPFATKAVNKRETFSSNSEFGELIQERSFYSFLVADLSQQPFTLNHEKASFRDSDLNQLETKHHGFARIKEWLNFDRVYNAQSELNLIAPELSSRERKLLPYLAQRMDWHHQAIMGAAREAMWNDLDLRFPTPQSQLFNHHAKKQQLDFPWVVSIARQESAFNPMARSHAGARGLMQLMPATAKQAAKKGKIPYRRVSELYHPETNIAIGTAHLAWLANRFENNKVFATAAYNAGSTAVKRWLKARGHLPLDVWIETIPYDETRRYVQNILAFRVIYSQRNNTDVRMFSPKEAASLSLAPLQTPLLVQKTP